MRRTTAIVLPVLMLLGCSTKFISSGEVSPGFDRDRSYKVAIMPLTVRGLLTPSYFARDKAYDHLLRTLMKTRKLQLMDKYTVEQQVKLEEFGSEGGVDPFRSRKVGKKIGADLVVIAECVFEEEAPEVILNTSVEVLDVNTTMQVYSGSARTVNPASTLAAAEAGLDLATDALVKKMK